LEALVRQKGLSASVFLHGKTDHSMLPFFYSASDLVFLPYPLLRLNEGSATAEAFSCGRPVVAFKRNDRAKVEQPGGFLVDLDPKAGGTAIMERLQDSSYLGRKGREGLQLSSQFSLERAGERLTEIYKSVLGH
jgi:glycosyltransferase involved in cell wall biosynthesis